MSSYPKTEAVLDWYWQEHKRNARLPDAPILVSDYKFVRSSRDPDLMVAILLVAVRIGRVLDQVAPRVARDLNFPEFINPFEGSPAPIFTFKEVLETNGRTINWRPVSALNQGLDTELHNLLVEEEKILTYEPPIVIPEPEIPDLVESNLAHKDYSPMSPRLFNPTNQSLDEEGLKIFKLIDPIAEQLDCSVGYRGDQIVGFNYSRKKPFLLFNPERERYARCGFTYMLNLFKKSENKNDG